MIRLRQEVGGATTKVSTNSANTFNYTTISSTSFTGDAFENAINFVKKQEGLASTQRLDTSNKNTRIPYASANASLSLILYPYNLEGRKRADGTPILTIGWGTNDTYRAGPKAGKIITPGDTITVDLAEQNLRVELASIYKKVTEAAKKNNLTLTTGQIVALLDLGFNAGPGAVLESPLWKSLLNKTSPDRNASIAFYAGGDFSGPLAKRRTLEYNAFIS